MKLNEVTTPIGTYERALKKAALELGYTGGEHRMMLDNGTKSKVFNRHVHDVDDFIVFACVWEPRKFLVWVGIPFGDDKLLRQRIGDQLFTAENYEQLLTELGKATQTAMDRAREVLENRHEHVMQDNEEIDRRSSNLFKLFNAVYTMVWEEADDVKAFPFNGINAVVTAMQLPQDEAEVLKKMVKPHAVKLMTADPCVGSMNIEVRPDVIDPKRGFTLNITWTLKQQWGNPRAINRTREDVMGSAVWKKFTELIEAR